MRLIDITHDSKDRYRLAEGEQAVFFMLNRDGDLAFELAGAGATAHVFAFFIGGESQKYALTLRQTHLAPRTVSSSLMKNILSGSAALRAESAIRIEPAAHRSDASHESRTLLLSPDAEAAARPALEILADDVICHHASTTSPVDDARLLYAMSRGLTTEAAEELLTRGFMGEALDRIASLGIDTAPLMEKLHHQLQTLYARP